MLDTQRVFEKPLARSLLVDDVYRGEINILAGQQFELSAKLGRTSRLAFVLLRASRTLGANTLLIRVQGALAPQSQLDNGGVLLLWDLRVTTAYLNLNATAATGPFTIDYLIGGYR